MGQETEESGRVPPYLAAPLVPVVASWVAGIVVAKALPSGWGSVVGGLTLALIGILFWGVSRKPWGRGVWVAILLAGCAVALSQREAREAAGAALGREPGPHWAKLRGEIVGMPVRTAQGQRGVKVEFQLIAHEVAGPDGVWHSADGRVLARGIAGVADQVHAGTRVELAGLLARPEIAKNPGEFDRAQFLARQGIGWVLRVEGDVVVLEAVSLGRWPVQVAQRFRDYMHRTLRLGLEGERELAGVLAGMLYGDRTDFGDELTAAFRHTGTMHLFAVSGQNVGVLMAIGLLVVRGAGWLRWRWGWILIPALGLYTLATGASPSAVRAWAMASLVLVAWALDRPVAAGQIIALAAWGILLLDPGQLWDVGFQLSFAVVIALTWLTPRLWQRVRHWGRPDPWVPRELWSRRCKLADPARRAALMLGCSGMAAFVGSTPLTWWYFHLVAPVSLLVNIPVVALATAMVGLGAASLSVAWAFPWGAVVCNKLNWVLASVLVGIIEGAAMVPGGWFYVGRPWDMWWKEAPRVTVMAVGEGQAVSVESSQGLQLIDVGDRSDATFVVEPFLRRTGTRTLQRLWLTQGDADHIGGGAGLLQRWRVAEVVTAALPNRSGALRSLERDYPGRLSKWTAPRTWDEAIGRWELLWPQQQKVGPLAQDRGLVIRFVTKSGASLLFAGDIGSAVESALLASGRVVQAEILVQGQHPKRDGFTEAWLERVAPRHLIFAGGGYRHASLPESVRADLVRQGCRLWDTARTGAVTCIPEGAQWKLESWLHRQERETPPHSANAD
jgi:competence protein ComEC